MTIAYFDLIGGAAGDMLLGALIDAGAPLAPLHDLMRSLSIESLKLNVHNEIRQYLNVTRVSFEAPTEQPHRHLKDVIELIEASSLAPGLVEQACRVFATLADAEAQVHGMSPEEVHFHEVGAVDSIADVVGVVAALDSLGVTSLEASPLPVCRGVIRGAHGKIPLPAPAVLRIAEAGRAPLEGRDGESELVTPTAAALLVTLGSGFGGYPAMIVESVGYGAGSRKAPASAPPNVTRVVLGTAVASAQSTPGSEVCVIEANLDDQTAEQGGYVAETLFGAGALDVFWTPAFMKKGRPGVVLSVLCDPASAGALEDLILRETTTLGIRRRLEQRVTLPREIVPVSTEHGEVRVKVATRPGGVRSGAPEYEDCAALARVARVPFQQVYRAAQAAWERADG
jgi:pyridinium-3,5-bisthiocarboxylic acid mononucleotide nickel chelatase